MESKEPTQEKIIEAVKKYYGLTIDENAYQALIYMLTKKQLQMVILYML